MPPIFEIFPLLKTWNRFLVCCLAALSLIWLADPARSAELRSSDANFLIGAAEDNFGEIALAKLALEKSARPDIKMFARQIVSDHEKANQNLKALATSKNLKVPDKPGAKNDSKKTRLEELSGQEFDNSFVKTQGDDHKSELEEYQRASKDAVDADVRKFASQMLPIFKEHLTMIQTIQSQLVPPGR